MSGEGGPSLGDLVGKWVLLAVHEHPLPKRKMRGASFVCAVCGQVRYSEGHACATCPASTGGTFAVCCPCFASAWTEQEECFLEAKRLEAEERHQATLKAAQWRSDAAAATGAASSVGAEGTAPGSGPRRQVAAGGAIDPLAADVLAALPPLLRACVSGDAVTAKDIVDKSDFNNDLDLEATASSGPHQGRTALILAAQFGHKAIVELLLNRDTQTDAVDDLGMTALMHASYNGHTDVVDELLFNGAIVDRVAFCGYTSMLFAASRGHTDAVRRLLAAGASPLARTPKGRNAVVVAAFNGHINVVKVLVQVSGIELDARDDEGYSAVDAAQANHYSTVEAVLVAAGATTV